ncbi:hypothetical protein [Synechococcus sp. 1G10]|uniref:hypothetical protein n=1 Tax=Synechococcus sp. 1G10 TaxID=2025605 RepID=UPI00117C4870|nr:hypothetical protein [Synechococcus sp. 1G10]
MTVPTDSRYSELWALQRQTVAYPAGMLLVPRPNPGRAFSPGGYGRFSANACFTAGGVMVVGQDFGNEVMHNDALAQGAEPSSNPTWQGILPLLQVAGIRPPIASSTTSPWVFALATRNRQVRRQGRYAPSSPGTAGRCYWSRSAPSAPVSSC